MAQVSRRTRIIRRVLVGVLAVSVVVAAVAIKNRIDQGNEVIVEGSAMQPNRPPVPTMSSAGSDPSAPLKNGSAPHAPMTSASPQQPQATSTAAPQGSLALIISLITSVTSVLGLLMSKYTEWQRARLEQMKLAIELQRKDLAARLSTTALPFSPCRPRGQASASKTERQPTALIAHRVQAL